MPLWQALAKDASDPELPPPYWAFAWAGGQALARYVLDHPDVVRGARVLDFATGSGLCAIAALQAGATDVLGADVDPWSADAVALNAALHGVHIPFVGGDPIDDAPPDVDVILAGDIGYEWNLATRGSAWLRQRGRSRRPGAHRRSRAALPAARRPHRRSDLRGAHDARPGADGEQAHDGIPGRAWVRRHGRRRSARATRARLRTRRGRSGRADARPANRPQVSPPLRCRASCRHGPPRLRAPARHAASGSSTTTARISEPSVQAPWGTPARPDHRLAVADPGALVADLDPATTTDHDEQRGVGIGMGRDQAPVARTPAPRRGRGRHSR